MQWPMALVNMQHSLPMVVKIKYFPQIYYIFKPTQEAEKLSTIDVIELDDIFPRHHSQVRHDPGFTWYGMVCRGRN